MLTTPATPEYTEVKPELIGYDRNRTGSKISVHFNLPGFGDGSDRR